MSIRDNPPGSVNTAAVYDAYRTLYDDITSGGQALDVNHRHALGQLACLTVEIDKLSRDVAEHGAQITVNGDKGNTVTKRNASAEILHKSRTQYFQLLKEFKMTPASSKKTNGLVGVQRNDDGWDEV